MDMVVIINPISGSRGRFGTARQRVELARTVLAAMRVAGEVYVTQRAGHAFELAQEATRRGASLVCAWGGDGTVNDVGRALAFTGVSLGIIPAGSGNGLARNLGVPVRPAEALRAALRGTDRAIDAGEMGGRLFFNVAGIGLDAHIAAGVNSRPQGCRGLLPYISVTTEALFRYRPRRYAIKVDGDVLRPLALLVACANGRQYGYGAVIAPRAQPDDGVLDLVMVEGRPPLRRLWDARRLFAGSLDAAPGVLMRPFKEMEVTADEPLLFHVDGEPATGSTRLTARVHPNALRIRTAGTHEPAQ